MKKTLHFFGFWTPPTPPPTDWFGDAEEAGVAQSLEDFVGWKRSLGLPLLHVRVDLLLDDLRSKNIRGQQQRPLKTQGERE